MALSHKAFTFDHNELHRKLTNSVVTNDVLDLKLLHDFAQNAIENRSATTQQVLECLRFEQDWLDTTDRETMRAHLWYLIALAQELSPAPSLSNRYRGSYGVLKLILPLGGWNSSEIQDLILGQPLHTLLQTFNKDLLGTASGAINQFGGWLSLDKIQESLIRIKSSRNYFSHSAAESIETLVNAAVLVSAQYSQSPLKQMEDSYSDAIDMLQTAVNKGTDLFMVLD